MKRFIAGLLTGVIIAGGVATAGLGTVVKFEGETLTNKAYIEEGRTYAPVRELAEKLGFEVEWTGEKVIIHEDTEEPTALQRPTEPYSEDVMMDSNDWDLVKQYANEYDLDPYLIPAIGWHETNWGNIGIGRDFILGYGFYGAGNYEDWARGVENQIHYTAQQIARQHEDRDLTEITNDDLQAIAEVTYRPAGFGEDNPYEVWANNVGTYFDNIK